ncbi:MAG TPA: sigma-70 family RNA polymerase sigma factor [Anaerolineales bacterium]|nr:sigma-70 family RNA polymerase sigma factor [Anaerolineales bacterium]
MQTSTLSLLVAMALTFTTKPHGQLTDETLAARISQGDVSALETLYERYAPIVMGITLKVTGDRALAEDTLQETFWQVWKNAAAYQPESGPFTGWLFRMARQIALHASRNRVSEKVSKN